MKFNELTKEKEELLLQEKENDLYSLILFNDDVNTFEHVIDCLIAICNHDSLQAEQCAFLVHYNGKTDIKSGSFEELEPRKTALNDKGLSVSIEKSN